MNHIIILTHGNLSQGLAHSMRFILGDADAVTALSITMEMSAEFCRNMLREFLDSFDQGQPVLVLTDIPQGSTTQAALAVLPDYPDMYLISGVNLGLLLSVAMLELGEDREKNRQEIEEAVSEAKETLMLVTIPETAAGCSPEDDEL